MFASPVVEYYPVPTPCRRDIVAPALITCAVAQRTVGRSSGQSTTGYGCMVHSLGSAYRRESAHRGHLNIRNFIHAMQLQVLDLFHIANGVFAGRSAALKRSGNCLISLMVRCR